MFKDSFVKSHIEKMNLGKQKLQNLWSDILGFSNYVSDEIPNFKAFYNYIQNGEFDKAVDTKVLTALIESKFAKTETCHLTADKLLKPNGERVWSIRWIDSIISDINTGNDSKDIEDKFNLVELQFKIEKEKRRINTEFFYYNPAKSFDDREKLHIVWKVPNESSQQLDLVYLGVGTNEPFDFQHIETGTESCKGRARFYIYESDDSGNKAIKAHQFQWKKMGRFDWAWNNYPVRKENIIYKTYFVDYLGMRICLSDPNMANAANSLTADNVFQMLCKNLQLPVVPISQAALADREAFLDSISLIQVQVSPLQENCQVTPPDYRVVLRDAVKNYNAYFTIFGCVHLREKDPVQLRSNIKQLKDARMEYYENIFATQCKDAIRDEYNCFLNGCTLEDLFVNPIQNNWPKDLQERVRVWKETLSNEMALDLYHYGPYASERMMNLLFAVDLATNPKYGDLYNVILCEAKRIFFDDCPYGEYDIELPN